MKKYNMSEIMTAAWAAYRERVAYLKRLNPKMGGKLLKSYSFSDALKLAWLNAKIHAADKRAQLEKLNDGIFDLDMKDRLTNEDGVMRGRLAAERDRLAKAGGTEEAEMKEWMPFFEAAV